MYDYGLSVIDQYGLTLRNSWRGRGALICQTEEQLYILRPFDGSRKRLDKQRELLDMLRDESDVFVDAVVPTLSGEPVSTDAEGKMYVLRHWYDGKECDTRSEGDILRSVDALGRLHKAMRMTVVEDYVEESLETEYLRHNRELRKIQKFIRKKKVGNRFEREYLNSVDEFLAWGEETLAGLRGSGFETLRQQAVSEGWICHGEFNQHHVLLGRACTAVTGFDKWKYGVQTADLYGFMRKILEKSRWDPRLGRAMLETYERQRPLSAAERENLRLRFSYPEKYWKLANHYYCHNKAWLPEKNVEKLCQLISQKELWREFVKNCF